MNAAGAMTPADADGVGGQSRASGSGPSSFLFRIPEGRTHYKPIALL